MRTVSEPVTTTPGPCGGIGSGVAQRWMSAPPAAPVIIEPMVAAAVALAVCSAASAAGAPGVPAAAMVAASATWIAASEVALAAWIAAAAAAVTPRQAGRPPISTVKLPGPGWSTGGSGCATGSRMRAAGPFGMAGPQEPAPSSL